MEISALKNRRQEPEGKEVVVILFQWREPGSVTVFLTMIFLLMFSLLGVTYDCARMSAVRGYLKVAGSSAARTVFGDFNRELYQEYGLLGYGGYDGRNREDLNRDFLEVLEKNLKICHDNFPDYHADIYRISQMESTIEKSAVLTEEDVFYDQIAAFLKNKTVKDVADAICEKVKGCSSGTDLDDKLDLADRYELGDYEGLRQEEQKESGEPRDEKDLGTEESNKSGDEGGIGKNEPQTSGGGDEKGAGNGKSSVKDSAGGNPLEAFSHMMRDGVLSMVCRDENLSEAEIIPREGKEDSQREGDAAGMGAADLLKGFLKNENSLENVSQMPKGKKKMLLLAYTGEVCSDYLEKKEEGIRYAKEYLAAGKGEERSNLASVVNRLLAVRMLLNFAYVAADPALQEKSLATATALAGFTGLPPVITGVQYTILLILSFQEACVDVTALLDGKAVPVMKSSANFKMKYEEICLGTKTLFQKKAAGYGNKKGGSGMSITYKEYLTAFLLLVDEKTLYNRTLDAIQQDLREKYNQSFCIDDCISKSTYRMTFELNFVFQQLPFLDQSQWGQSVGRQCQEVSYGYKSR